MSGRCVDSVQCGDYLDIYLVCLSTAQRLVSVSIPVLGVRWGAARV